VEKVKNYAKRTPKPSKSLQKRQKEVKLEDVHIALADFIIDSFLENRKVEKVVNLNRTQLNRKSL
jgi:hypothetical protein